MVEVTLERIWLLLCNNCKFAFAAQSAARSRGGGKPANFRR
jgi:hypothetical protein